jgi:adenine-specific DNA glycosylase
MARTTKRRYKLKKYDFDFCKHFQCEECPICEECDIYQQHIFLREYPAHQAHAIKAALEY